MKKFLNDYKEYFLIGLHQYKSEATNNPPSKKSDISDRLSDFVKRLQFFLDVNTEISRTIIAQYLSCEFHGTPTTLQNQTLTHTSSTKLLRDIWFFHTSERMYYLKTLKLILEYHKDSQHPYRKEFAEFVDDCNVEVLRKSLTSQLKLLISVNINLSDDMNQEMQTLWVKRNLQEQLEVLECILLTQDLVHIGPGEFIGLLELFGCHRFGSQPIYLTRLGLVPKHLLMRLTYCEIGLLLTILDYQKFLKNYKEWDLSVKKEVDIWITRLHNEYDIETVPIILAWALIRCNNKYQPTETLIQGTYNQLHIILTDRIFNDDTKPTKLIRQSFYNLLTLLSNREFIPKNETLYYKCLGCTLKDPEIGKAHLKKQEESDDIPREIWTFPFNFTGYSILASELASNGTCLNKIIKESLSLPVTCLPLTTELHQMISLKNGIWRLNHEFFLFGNPNFKIPSDTFCFLEPPDNPLMLVLQSSINYWSVFQHLLSSCVVATKGGKHAPFDDAKAGLRFWIQVLNNVEEIGTELIKPLGLTFDLMSEMLLKRMTDTEIFALALEAVTAVYKITGAQYICDKLRQISFFPVLVDSFLPLEELIKPSNFIQGRIFELILDYDLVHNRFDLLLAYFKFLRIRFQVSLNFFILV